MACIITYENKQYTQKEFEQYFKEHFTEFVGEFINTQPDVVLPIGTSGSGKSTFIKSLPQENLVVIEPDAMRVEFTGDMNNKSKDKEIYEEAAKRAIVAIRQGKQVVFDTTNLTKDKRLPFIEAIKKEILTANIQYKLMELNPELAKQRIKAQLARGENRAAVSDETIDRHATSYKQMLEDIKTEPITEYKELGSTQDIEGFKKFVSNKDADLMSFSSFYPSNDIEENDQNQIVKIQPKTNDFENFEVDIIYNDESIGRVDLKSDGSNLSVTGAIINNPQLRNKGIGYDVMNQLGEYANSINLTLTSDDRQTIQDKRVWDKLVQNNTAVYSNNTNRYYYDNQLTDNNKEPILLQTDLRSPELSLSIPVSTLSDNEINTKKPIGTSSSIKPLQLSVFDMSGLSDISTLDDIRNAFSKLNFDIEVPLKKTFDKFITKNPKASNKVIPVVEFMYNLFRYDHANNSKLINSLRETGYDSIIVYNNKDFGIKSVISFNNNFVALEDVANDLNSEANPNNNQTLTLDEFKVRDAIFPDVIPGKQYTLLDTLNNISTLDNSSEVGKSLAKTLVSIIKSNPTLSNTPVFVSSGRSMVTNEVDDSFIDNYRDISASTTSNIPGGLYNSDLNLIKVNFNSKNPSNILLHESLHAITYNKLRENTDLNKMFNNFFNQAKKILIENGVDPNNYYLTNSDEFITGLFTSKDFINKLYNAPSTGIGLGKGSENLWSEFVKVLAKVLNLDLSKDSLLSESLNNVMFYIEEVNNEPTSTNTSEENSDLDPFADVLGDQYSYSSYYPDGEIIDEEAESPEETIETESTININFVSDLSEKQKKIVDKIEKTRSNLRGKVRMSSEDLLREFPKSRHIKLLSKVKDGLVRNVIWDEEQQKEIIVEKRPSDFSQLLYASIKNFDKKLHSEENDALNSIYQRGIGTVSHEIVQQILMQLDDLNKDFSIIKPHLSLIPKSINEFFTENYQEKFINKLKEDSLKDTEVGKMLASLGKTNTYSVTLDEDKLLDPGSSKTLTQAERTFTVSNEDFDQLAKLAFKLYYQIYKTQAQISYINKLDTVNAPVIMTEAPIYNKQDSVLGSIDVLTVFSNGQVGQLDFKFIDLSSAMKKEQNLSPEKIKTQKVYNIKTKNGTYIVNSTMTGDEYIDFEVNRKMFIKVKSYEKQISAYKKGLIDSYGIPNEDVIISRIVPVNTILDYTTEETEVKDPNSNKTIRVRTKNLKPSVKYYEHEDKLLEQIPVAGELTGDPALDEFVHLLQKRLDNILLKIEKSPFDEKLISQRDNILLQLKTLQVKKDVKTIAYQLKNISQSVLDSLEEEKFIKIQVAEGDEYLDNPGYLTFMDLYDLEAIMQVYSVFRDSVRNQLKMYKDNYSEEEYNEVNKIVQDQNQLTMLILDRIKTERDKRLIEALEKSDELKNSGNEPSVTIDGKQYTFDISSRLLRNAGVGSDSRLSKFKDLSSVTGMYLTSLKDMNHPHLKMFSDLLDNLNADVRIFTEDMKLRVESETNLLKEWSDSSGLKANEVYDLLYDPINGELYKEFDRSFYKALNEARKNKDITWLKENIEFNEESYNRRRLFQIKRLQDIYKNDPDSYNKAIRLWEESNDMRLAASDYPWYNTYNYSYKIKDSKLKEFRSSNWNYINKTPALKRYYDFYVSMNDVIDELTGGDYRINKTFVANVHKDTVDSLVQNGLLDAEKLSDIRSSLLNVLKVRENDEEFGSTIDEQPVDGVPLYFYDDINLKDKSKDLSKSLLLMLYSAKLYRASKDLEGVSYGIRNSLANTRLLKTDGLGNVIPDEYIDPYKTSETNFVKALDKYINFYIYGKKIQSETSGLSKQGVKVANEVLAIHSKINLAWNSLPLVAGHVNVHLQLRQLGSVGNHFTIKQLNSATRSFSKFDKKYGMLKHIFELSAEGHSGLVNEKANKVSLFKLRKAYDKSLAYIWQRRSDDAIDDTILDAMAQNYILHPNGVDVFPRSSANIYLKGTEWENRLDELKSIKDSLEVFDTENKASSTKLSDLYSIKRGNGEGEMTKIQYIKFRNKVQYLVNRAKGNYNKEDISLYKTSLLGRFLMQYRGWMPATIIERSMSPKYSYTMEEIQIGRYRTVLGEILHGTNNKIIETMKQLLSLGVDASTFRLFKLSKLNELTQEKLFNQWKINNPGDYEELLAKYQRFDNAETEAFNEWVKTNENNLTKMIAELRQYIMVSLFVLGVGFGFGDDETKENPMLRALVKHLNRVKLELGFYFNPDEFIKIATRSPMPVTSILSDLRRLIGNTIEETSDVLLGADKDKTIDYISAGDDSFSFNFFEEKKDESPRMKYTFRMIPMIKGASNLLELGQESKEKQTFYEWMFGYNSETFYK